VAPDSSQGIERPAFGIVDHAGSLPALASSVHTLLFGAFQPILMAPMTRSTCLRHFGAAGVDGERLRRRETRVIHNAERRALDALGLESGATTAEIKLRFKMLVKRHHPDSNGGDRSTEGSTARDYSGLQVSQVGGFR